MRREKERDRQTDRQTKKDRHAYRPTEIYEDEVIGKDSCVEKKERDRQTDRQTGQRDKERQTCI